MPRSELLNKPEYRVWADMKNRCQNPRNKDYRHYGQRGITVSANWQHFPAFFRDMGLRPSPLHTLDRINNNDGYHLDNCRWVLRRDQSRNHRRNVLITHQGRTQCLTDWCLEFGRPQPLVANRLRLGWSFIEAILPTKRRRPRLLQESVKPVR